MRRASRYCARCRAPHDGPCPITERLRQRDYDSTRPSWRYADRRWRAERAVWLSEHPLCAECERHGRVTQASVVDHVRPHRGDMDLFWDQSNWASMCAPCHNAKTRRGE